MTGTRIQTGELTWSDAKARTAGVHAKMNSSHGNINPAACMLFLRAWCKESKVQNVASNKGLNVI